MHKHDGGAWPAQFWCAALMAIAALGACSHGSSSDSSPAAGAPTALTVAEKVSVVDANATGTASHVASMTIGALLSPTDLPAGSAYFTDESHVYVHERIVESFNTVNEILCMVGQTRYDAMLNLGPYKAQVDRNQCSSDRDSSSSGGQQSQDQSSGATSPHFELFTVDSLRVDAASPEIVKAWVNEDGDSNGNGGSGEPKKLIFAKIVITEGKSDTNPYGLFTLNFSGHVVLGDGSIDPTPKFHGFLRTTLDASGKVLLQFASDDQGDTWHSTEQATLNRAADGASGGGTVFRDETSPFGSNTAQQDFAFDSAHFHRVSASDDWCGSRTQFDETAWRYGLYDASGNRVQRNSGFPVKVTQNGSDFFGWVGFWGAWFPESVTLANGDGVTRTEPGNTQSYTMFLAGGRLERHVKKTVTLTEITGVPLQYWDQGSGSQFRVVWTGTEFQKNAQLNQSDWTWQNITPVALTIDTNTYSLHFWSESLGGDGQVTVRDGSGALVVSDASLFVFHSHEQVAPTDVVPAAFVCFDNCPNVTNLATANPFDSFGQQNVTPDLANHSSYSFDSTTMLLKDAGAAPVVLDVANPAFPYGVRSGVMFEPTTANLDLLRCDWDATQTCSWQAWDRLDAYFTWETGPNNWNWFTALQSDAGFVTFEAPLQLKYVHNGDGYTNAVFYLQYSGFGNLWGIPGHCIDESGAEVSCSQNTRWVPAFTIPDGAVAVDASDNTTEYLIKALEKEQRMHELLVSDCTDLPTTAFALPALGDFVAPDIGDQPVVSAPPAVIGGVVQ